MTNSNPAVWQTIRDYCFRIRLFLLRPYRRQIRETKRQAQNLRDELYQKYLIEEMRKSYHKDVEAAMLMALEKYKCQKKLQQTFREAVESQTDFLENRVVENKNKDTFNSFMPKK
ncbi:hypothetical protein Gasu2_70580 [Galdieria sulphuraria]|uniref:Uncharacterized protein n=1 Tax=Galdieria sulphuraria TaxID=130081 RepID=M2W3Q8_GALSU|nr:uncharacterized protein Gasu_22450 [Galdieria sulphuraria]EME30336.1 hypothetical protein Gasu_22450 [Galdieria sulphuraria]GJD13002.1 hypothetical protein Gasu2_70580 [Galdieria sulphuraria]|eukprot:XP_005706856.1 hypothetical protein Gasu_22450 [Galdieria sulphuraria]